MQMALVIVRIVLLATTRRLWDHRLALCVLMAVIRRLLDHQLARMSQMVSAVKMALVLTLPVVLWHPALAQ